MGSSRRRKSRFDAISQALSTARMSFANLAVPRASSGPVVTPHGAVERHITLDRSMWGSNQVFSVEPHGFARLAKDIRAIESALGDGIKRVYDSELPIKQKLRRVG